MKKNKIRKILAAAGSFVVLTNGCFTMKSYAKVDYEGQEFLVSNREECRRLLMEIVSSENVGERKECFLTGMDYEPETLIIAQMFPDAVNISNTRMNEYDCDGHHYVTCRIGFERSIDTESKETQETEGDTQNRRWLVGDVRMLKIGEETYRFRCIDEDYRDRSGYQKCALFLCETVIRSDIDSSAAERILLPFGTTNNYKSSGVRKWLAENAELTDMVSVSTGVNTAFVGETVPKTYEEFSDSCFFRQALPIQSVTDQIFILSLEEALQYKEELWKVSGGKSPFSRGYWLRTPAFAVGEDGQFTYGAWEYMVDLEQGCIRQAAVDDGSIGIRPAFCLPQI